MDWLQFYGTHFKQPEDESGFVSNFGVSPTLCAWLWKTIWSAPSPPPIAIKPIYLLATLSFLKSYDNLQSLATKFRISEKSLRTWIWKIIDILAENLDEVISSFLN